ncbi:MAG: potassium-transporting ATPase subunit KdpC [bacterium]|nr:potassium-transporting ATPase subunit KdpC [bacterium]
MKTFIIAAKLIIVMTVVTGVLYPMIMLGAAQALFPHQANGSLTYSGGKLIGSELIAQEFADSSYFWPRPSGIGYNPQPSSGTNLGPTSKALLEQITSRRALLTEANGGAQPPDDLLLASGSGLDPHISPEAARYQIDRVARVRGLSSEKLAQLQQLVEMRVEPYSFGFIGQPRVNVFLLNLAVDSLFLSVRK